MVIWCFQIKQQKRRLNSLAVLELEENGDYEFNKKEDMKVYGIYQ